jgi:hypothetical protein
MKPANISLQRTAPCGLAAELRSLGVLALLAANSLAAAGYLTFSAIHVPSGYQVEKQRGPDFAVYSISAPDARLPILNVYDGNAPSFPSFCGVKERPIARMVRGFKEATIRADGGRCRETLLEIRQQAAEKVCFSLTGSDSRRTFGACAEKRIPRGRCSLMFRWRSGFPPIIR